MINFKELDKITTNLNRDDLMNFLKVLPSLEIVKYSDSLFEGSASWIVKWKDQFYEVEEYYEIVTTVKKLGNIK